MDSTVKKEKILVVEGDPTLAREIINALRGNGYMQTASSAGNEDSQKKIIDLLPHLIVLDISSGDESYEVLSGMQKEPLLSKIPVLLLSPHGVPINMQKVPKGSSIEFLVDLNVMPEDVLSKINIHFGYSNVAKTTMQGSERKKLVWVEDDKLLGKILEKKLVSSGFDLKHAKDGEEALEFLKAGKPDAIVIDLLLPGMNGFDLMERIQENASLKGVPVIVLSNLSKQADVEKAKSLGADRYLVKAATSLDQIIANVRELVFSNPRMIPKSF